MSDYIRREDVIALAKDIIVLARDGSIYRHRSIDPHDVMEMPAADVRENVRGEWEFNCDTFVIRKYLCSQCSIPHDKESQFCPNCGADMRGEKDE